MQTGAPEAPQGDIDVGTPEAVEGRVGGATVPFGSRSKKWASKGLQVGGWGGDTSLPNQAGTGEMCDGPVSSEARHRFSLRAMSG